MTEAGSHVCQAEGPSTARVLSIRKLILGSMGCASWAKSRERGRPSGSERPRARLEQVTKLVAIEKVAKQSQMTSAANRLASTS